MVDRSEDRPAPTEREVAPVAVGTVHGDPVLLAGRGGERHACAVLVRTVVVVLRDAGQPVDARAGVDGDHRVEVAVAELERGRPARGSRPAVPDRGRSVRTVLGLSGLEGRIAVVARDLTAVARELGGRSEVVVRRPDAPAELEVPGLTVRAVDGDPVRDTGARHEGQPALIAAAVVVGRNLLELRDVIADVHGQERIELRVTEVQGRAARARCRPAVPDRGSAGIPGVIRLAGLLRRLGVVALDPAEAIGDRLGVGEVVVRRRRRRSARGCDQDEEQSHRQESSALFMFPSSEPGRGRAPTTGRVGPAPPHSRGLELPPRLTTLRPEDCDGREIPLHFADETRSL